MSLRIDDESFANKINIWKAHVVINYMVNPDSATSLKLVNFARSERGGSLLKIWKTLVQLYNWIDKWHVKYESDKYKILYIG